MKTKNKGLRAKNKVLYKTKILKHRKKPKNYFENFFQNYVKTNIDIYNLMDNRPQLFKSPFLNTIFSACTLIASLWFILCYHLSYHWILELGQYVSIPLAHLIVLSIALIPGFMNMYLLVNFLIDKRKTHFEPLYFPSLTILIAAYNEEKYIKKTLLSINKQIYPADIQVILIDDGSSDKTIEIAKNIPLKNFSILKTSHKGKSYALNSGLVHAQHEYIITVDADTILDHHAIYEVMKKLLSSSKNTVACAGSVFVKNEGESLITQLQFWDYLLAISIIKRAQSFLQGTLVAQGAFSAYKKSVLMAVNGWPNLVGEDIVLTWAMLDKGYETTYAENAIAFTSAPISYKYYFHQRTRWARGLIEAFIQHKRIFLKKKIFIFFIYWNLFFIMIDIIRFFVIIPGIILFFMGKDLFIGPFIFFLFLTGSLNNLVFFMTQRKLFKSYGYYLKLNPLSFCLYSACYQYLMNIPVVYGYYLEFFKRKKSWGTK